MAAVALKAEQDAKEEEEKKEWNNNEHSIQYFLKQNLNKYLSVLH